MSLKFNMGGTDFMRVDGVWFEYKIDQYYISTQSILLETLYQNKKL